MTLLSVIVPVFNSGKYLDASLKCIKNQDIFNKLEIIFVNDGSLDDSKIILCEFVKIFKNSKLINNAKNLGYGQSCNLGIEESTGKFISFFEPDDEIPPDFYSVLVENIGQSDVIKYNGIFLDDGRKRSRLFKYRNIPDGEFDFCEYSRFWTSHPCIVNGIYRRSFFTENKIKFCKGRGASYQDCQFNVMLFYSKPKIRILDFCKYVYKKHDNQSISTLTDDRLLGVIDAWLELEIILKRRGVDISEDYFFIQINRQIRKLLEKCDVTQRVILENYLVCRNKKVVSITSLLKFNYKITEIIKYYLGVVCQKIII